LNDNNSSQRPVGHQPGRYQNSTLPQPPFAESTIWAQPVLSGLCRGRRTATTRFAPDPRRSYGSLGRAWIVTLMTSAPLLLGFLLFQRQFVQSFMRAGIR